MKFLVHFYIKHKYLDFCINELESLANMLGVLNLWDEIYCRPNLQDIKKSPCIWVNLPSTQIC